MQIEIDFEVFKTLTALRESEADSYNSVVRRLLKLPDTILPLSGGTATRKRGLFGAGRSPASSSTTPEGDKQQMGLLQHLMGGIWFGNVHFPDGTRFRANYKGRTHQAEIKNGQWLGDDGVFRRSPSDAAGAISGTNVNGWRFWNVQLPSDPTWQRLEDLRR
jgi:hypothetical protein